jgi:hypothetical protein
MTRPDYIAQARVIQRSHDAVIQIADLLHLLDVLKQANAEKDLAIKACV